MAAPPATDNPQNSTRRLHTYLEYLHLPYVREHHATLAQEAAEHSWPSRATVAGITVSWIPDAAFEQDAKDFAGFSATKLDMPFLVLTGEKASGTVLMDQTSW